MLNPFSFRSAPAEARPVEMELPTLKPLVLPKKAETPPQAQTGVLSIPGTSLESSVQYPPSENAAKTTERIQESAGVLRQEPTEAPPRALGEINSSANVPNPDSRDKVVLAAASQESPLASLAPSHAGSSQAAQSSQLSSSASASTPALNLFDGLRVHLPPSNSSGSSPLQNAASQVSPVPDNAPPPPATTPPLIAESNPNASVQAGAVAEAAAPPAAKDPAQEMLRIQAKADNVSTSKESTHLIINDIMKTLAEMPGFTPPPVLKTQFVTQDLQDPNAKINVEPFTLRGQTCHKVEAMYSVIIDSADGSGKKTISFKKAMFTNADTPEMAIRMAADTMHKIGELAKLGVVPSEFDNNPDFEKGASHANHFYLNYSYKADGSISGLSSFGVMSADNKKIEHQVAANPNKYIYDAKSNTYEVSHTPQSRENLLPGQVILDTEAEALMHKQGYRIANENLAGQMQQGKSAQEIVGKIKDEIQKKEEEFTALKATIIKEPGWKVVSWLKSGSAPVTLTEETGRIQQEGRAFRKVLEGKSVPPKELTENMQEYVKLEEEIENDKIVQKQRETDLLVLTQIDISRSDAGERIKDLINVSEYGLDDSKLKDKSSSELLALGKQAIETKIQEGLAAIASKETKLESLKSRITEEQSGFNNRLTSLHKCNKDLEDKVNQLKQLKEEALQILNADSSTPEQIKEAKALLKGLPDPAKLDAKVKKNEEAFNSVIEYLKKVGADKASVQKEFEVFEQLPE